MIRITNPMFPTRDRIINLCVRRTVNRYFRSDSNVGNSTAIEQGQDKARGGNSGWELPKWPPARPSIGCCVLRMLPQSGIEDRVREVVNDR